MAHVDGTTGNDTIRVGSASPGVTPPTGATDGPHTIHPGAGNDIVLAGAGDDIVDNLINDVGQGNGGNDSLNDGDGDDFLSGLGGTDFLDGDEGNDRLNGGAGNDFYDFNSTSESAVGIGNTDIIQSFNFGRGSRGDEINASSIDANVVAPGDQAFQFIDTAPFTPNHSGQINVINGPGESTLVQLNTDNDVFAESQIQVNDGSGAPRILGRR